MFVLLETADRDLFITKSLIMRSGEVFESGKGRRRGGVGDRFHLHMNKRPTLRQIGPKC